MGDIVVQVSFGGEKFPDQWMHMMLFIMVLNFLISLFLFFIDLFELLVINFLLLGLKLSFILLLLGARGHMRAKNLLV
jgi:hypothetical protein